MKNMIKNKSLTIILIFTSVIICLFAYFFTNTDITYAYAKEKESEDVLDEQVIVDTSEVELLIRLKYGCNV